MATDSDTDAFKQTPRPPVRRVVGLGIAGVLIAACGLSLGLVWAGQSTESQSVLVSLVNGQPVAGLGRLKIEGLSGDLWHQAHLRRLSLADKRGVWLQADGVRIGWQPLALLKRSLQIDGLTIDTLTVRRLPTLEPVRSAGPLLVDLDLRALHVGLVTEPALTRVPGRFAVIGRGQLSRDTGPWALVVTGVSPNSAGDRFSLNLSRSVAGQLQISAKASESPGGAMAGGLGLSPDRDLHLSVLGDATPRSGRIDAQVLTGHLPLLQANGHWADRTGMLQAKLFLKESSWTRAWTSTFGAEPVLTMSARPAPGSRLSRWDGAISAGGAQLQAYGNIDLGAVKTDAAGVTVNIAIEDLGRLVGPFRHGSLHYQGVFTGSIRASASKGALRLTDVRMGDVALSQILGPVEGGWDANGLRLTTRLTGSSVSAQGWSSALGSHPLLTLRMIRPVDSRWRIQSAELVGRLLRMQADGGERWPAGYGINGRLWLTDLAALSPRAKGRLDGRWSATLARSDAPWLITADLQARGLSVGSDSLDGMIGPQPRLQLRSTLSAGVMAVQSAQIVASRAKATFSGTLASDRPLALGVIWQAQGPFRAGPVEWTGEIAGRGQVHGKLLAPEVSLSADLGRVDLPGLILSRTTVGLSGHLQEGGVAGQANLLSVTDYGDLRAATDYNLAAGSLTLNRLQANGAGATISGSAKIGDSAASSADLEIGLGPGALIDAGHAKGHLLMTPAPREAQVLLTLAGDNVHWRGQPLTIATGTMSAAGPLSRLALRIGGRGTLGDYPWSLAGHGLMDPVSKLAALTFEGDGLLAGNPIKTLEPANIRFEPQGVSGAARVAAGGGEARLDVQQNRDRLVANATVAGVSLTALNPDLAGTFNARIALTAADGQLQGQLHSQLIAARSKGMPVANGLNGQIDGQLERNVLSLGLVVAGADGLAAKADLDLPVQSSASPLRLAIDRRAPIHGHVAALGEVRPLWDLVIGGDRSVQGKLDLNGDITGSLGDPKLAGRLALSEGQFNDGESGLRLQKVQLSARMTGSQIQVDAGTAEDGRGGTAKLTGTISLVRDGASDLQLDIARFQLIQYELGSVIASGWTTARRDPQGRIRLSGVLTVDRANFDARPPVPSGVTPMEVIEINPPLSATVHGVQTQTPTFPVDLDVGLQAKRGVFVSGRGLDMEFALAAHVGGSLAQPQLDGTATIVRGNYDFAGKRFQFDDRGVVRLSTDPAKILLNLTASRNDPTLTASVHIDGTAAAPRIGLTSIPERPTDEILSLVLFGASATQLSSLEAAQLASAVAALAGGGGFDVIGDLRSLAQLDRLAFASGTAGDITVAGGKYLTDDVYLEILGGGREGPAAQVEWRFGRNISLVSKLISQRDAKVSVRWHREY